MKSVRKLLGVEQAPENDLLLRTVAGQCIDAGPTDERIANIGETACP
jgi:hypothetical protein